MFLYWLYPVVKKAYSVPWNMMPDIATQSLSGTSYVDVVAMTTAPEGIVVIVSQ